ncbi:MAG: hypothetical protein OEZ16_03785 [Chromatiales bacterium]|nr:hypothetical protein [Chromatiales bacterium]
MNTPYSRVIKPVVRAIMLVAIPLLSFASVTHAIDLERPVFEFQSKLANQGNATAQYFLAQMYEEGRGTEANPELAKQWYEKAKLNGYEPGSGAGVVN